MKERLLRWFVIVLMVSAVRAEKSSNPKDDEDNDGYDIRTNEVDEQDEATSRMLQLINNAAMKIVDAPDLSKVITSPVSPSRWVLIYGFEIDSGNARRPAVRAIEIGRVGRRRQSATGQVPHRRSVQLLG